MTTWEFPCPEPAAIAIGSWGSGSVAISGEPTDVLAIEIVGSQPQVNVDDLLEQVKVNFEYGKLSVKGPMRSLRLLQRLKGLDLTIKAPAGSDCRAETASAGVAFIGQLGELIVNTASGDVTATTAGGPVKVETASGDVFVEHADTDVSINTASGDVQVGYTGGELRVSAVSGDLSIGDVRGTLGARTVSGDIAVTALTSGQAELVTTSGDVQVAVTPGIGVYLDLSSLSGRVRSDLDEVDGGDAGTGASLEIRCRTISGAIRIAKVPAAA